MFNRRTVCFSPYFSTEGVLQNPSVLTNEQMPSRRLSLSNWILARDAYCGVLQSRVSIS